MPIYKFYCPNCKTPRNIKESMTMIDKVMPLCPKCEQQLQRVFTAPGVHYKGPGWTKQAKK